MNRLRMLVTLLVSAPFFCEAQVISFGAEFQVNTTTSGFQFGRGGQSVSADANGFVAVWDNTDNVIGNRFDTAGARIGSEFLVNSFTGSVQIAPTVAKLPSGGFVVAWESYGQDGSGYGVFGQRFNSTGTRAGTEFRINNTTNSDQERPAMAAQSTGGFVVVWQSWFQDRDYNGIFGQRFSSAGAKMGSAFQVNTYTTEDQAEPAIATLGSDRFVVVWESFGQDGNDKGVFGQIYTSTGVRSGSEFQVNSVTGSYQRLASVAGLPTGGFIVSWDTVNDGDGLSVAMRRFTSTGVALGSESQVNTYTTEFQGSSAVAVDSTGAFVVAWDSRYQDDDYLGSFAQAFNSSGSAVGAEFQLNTFTEGHQNQPSIATMSDNHFVVVWNSYPGFITSPQDGDQGGVFARRIGNTPLLTASPTVGGSTPTATPSPTATDSPAVTVTSTPTASVTATTTGTATETPTQTPTATETPSATPSHTGTASPTDTPSSAATASPTASATKTPSLTATETPTITATASATASATATTTGTATETPTETPTATETPSATPSRTGTASPTDTPSPTTTSSPTASATETPTNTATASATPTTNATETGSATPTETPTVVVTPTATTSSVAECGTTPVPSCNTSELRSKLKIKNTGKPAQNQMVWKWSRGDVDVSEFGDPTATATFAMCVFRDDALAVEVNIESGTQWKSVPRGFTYKNLMTNPDGAFKIMLKQGLGKAKVLLKAKGLNLPVPTLPLNASTSVRVQLRSSGGQCWESSFTPAEIREKPKMLKAKTR